MSRTPRTPRTPGSVEDDTVDDDKPLRVKFPFDLVGRGYAGIEEMQGYLEDTKVYFGLLQIQVGSGSFARSKSIFIHFNGEKHPKPLQRAKENKLLAKAQSAFRPWHAELALQTQAECTVNEVFSRLKGLFVADTLSKKASKFDLGSLKEDYKKRMAALKSKAASEPLSLKEMKAKLKEQRKREAEERVAAERQRKEAARLKAEAEAEAERIKADAEKEAERIRLEDEESARKAAEEAAAAAAVAAEAEAAEKLRSKSWKKRKAAAETVELKTKSEEELGKKKKKMIRRRRGRRKKDDWSNAREWTGKRLVACIHERTSPFNWAVFQPSHSEALPLAYGHGSLEQLREALRPDQVMYGIMRLTFGDGRWQRSHWIFFTWVPRSMSDDAPPRMRSKKINERLVSLGCKLDMQKLIGPFGVEIEADDIQDVTLERWIMRVRRTVVVDGLDDFMNEESLRKALEAEEAHFAQLEEKRKEKAARLEAERESSSSLLTGDSTPDHKPDTAEVGAVAITELKLESVADDDIGDDDESEEDAAEGKSEGKAEARTTPKPKGLQIPSLDAAVTDELDAVTEDVPTPAKSSKKKKKKKKRKWPPDSSDDESTPATDRLSTPKASTPVGTPRRRKRLTEEEKEAREVESTMVHESVLLVQNVQTEFTWILVTPRL